MIRFRIFRPLGKIIPAALKIRIYLSRYFHTFFRSVINSEEKKKDDDDTPTGTGGGNDEKTIKTSSTDPESGWFHKGQHKQVLPMRFKQPVINSDGF